MAKHSLPFENIGMFRKQQLESAEKAFVALMVEIEDVSLQLAETMKHVHEQIQWLDAQRDRELALLSQEPSSADQHAFFQAYVCQLADKKLALRKQILEQERLLAVLQARKHDQRLRVIAAQQQFELVLKLQEQWKSNVKQREMLAEDEGFEEVAHIQRFAKG